VIDAPRRSLPVPPRFGPSRARTAIASRHREQPAESSVAPVRRSAQHPPPQSRTIDRGLPSPEKRAHKSRSVPRFARCDILTRFRSGFIEAALQRPGRQEPARRAAWLGGNRVGVAWSVQPFGRLRGLLGVMVISRLEL
jgi:hypothetical protein